VNFVGEIRAAAGRRRFGTGVLGSLTVALIAFGAQSQAPAQEDPGRFEIRSAGVELRGGVYYLDAWVEYRLSTEAREALDAGVALTLETEVEFLRIRRFWLDDQETGLSQGYELQYHALSERYLVVNLNSAAQSSYATLFSALNYLGRITKLPLIDASLLDSESNYEIRIRAVLSTEEMPGPLRLLAFWRRDWSLESEWYTWLLDE
jgi:hypothetical protein